LPCLALLATAASMLLSRSMFRFIGARRTRVLAQVIAALLGSTGLVLTQLPQLWPDRERAQVVLTLFDYVPPESHPFWWPARIAMGESALGSIATLLGLIGIFALSMSVSARGFIADLASAGSATAPTKRKPRPELRPFRTDPRFNLIRKELRLLVRDPWLLTQLLQQNLYLIPLALALWRGLGRGPSVAWAAVVMAATTISGALAWLAGAGEDAPDLLRSSPLRPVTQWRAKLCAALLPAASFVSISSLILALQQRYWSALAIGVCGSASALCSALLHIRARGGPNKRRDLRNRYQSGTLLALFDFAMMMVWVLIAVVVLFWEG
jgi:ABC-2 type transport system permease protein